MKRSYLAFKLLLLMIFVLGFVVMAQAGDNEALARVYILAGVVVILTVPFILLVIYLAEDVNQILLILKHGKDYEILLKQSKTSKQEKS